MLYNPQAFASADATSAVALMERYPFASLCTVEDGRCAMTHVPTLVRQGPLVIYGHLARANAHWRSFDGRRALCVFRGPDSYISPAWYSSPEMVPTWNYAVVHASGPITAIEDPTVIERFLYAAAEQYEAGRIEPWRLASIAEEYRTTLARGIVAFELRVEQLEGKFKLSQNLSSEDRCGAIHGLLGEPRDQRIELAHMMMADAGSSEGEPISTDSPPYQKESQS